MNKIQEFISGLDPLTRALILGAFGGFVAAAKTDYAAFRAWKSFNDASKYAWNLAIWRWFQGIVVGAVTGGGLGKLFGL